MKKKSKKKEFIDPALSQQLREAREKKGLTQLEVATIADVSETFYAMTERGEANPAAANLEKMFKAVGLKLSAKKS